MRTFGRLTRRDVGLLAGAVALFLLAGFKVTRTDRAAGSGGPPAVLRANGGEVQYRDPVTAAEAARAAGALVRCGFFDGRTHRVGLQRAAGGYALLAPVTPGAEADPAVLRDARHVAGELSDALGAPAAVRLCDPAGRALRVVTP